MSDAHLYLFSDACPTDWLSNGQDEAWHTIVNVAFQSAPNLQTLIDQGEPHDVVLAQDPRYTGLVNDIEKALPSGRLQKWSAGRDKRVKAGYRTAFSAAFASLCPDPGFVVSGCSFQEKTLRASKQALLNSYNERLGGMEGLGIGFKEYIDTQGRNRMEHSFINFHGCHEIAAPEEQMLVLLLMSWFVADQYVFFFNEIVNGARFGFDRLGLTVVSDKLSGDDNLRSKSEQNLRNLIDPEAEGAPVILRRSPASDSFSGDLLVDNLAGWLTSAISDPASDYAEIARRLIPSGVWNGWHQLTPSHLTLSSVPATQRLLM